MKSRLPFLLLGLVMFATALLSILAARSLRQDALQAQRYLEEQARHVARAVAQDVSGKLTTELDHVRGTISDTVAARGDLRLIESLATRITEARPLVAQVYLFMNPWGLLWPTEAALTPELTQHRQELLATLRGLTASSATGDVVAFSLHGAPHLFAALEGRKVFFVGCALDPEAVASVVEQAVRNGDGGGLVLGAEGAGLRVAPPVEADAVRVSDSFGQSRDIGAERGAAPLEPLLTRSLDPPLELIRVFVYAVDPAAATRLIYVRRQLYGWGIALLALCIMGGVLWLVARARAEVQRARSGSEFAIGVSHDLRTPLAAMRVMTESLYLGHVPDPVRRQEFLRTILAECERLSQLTERVLYLFRFGQDAVQYRLGPGDPAAVVRESVQAFERRMQVESEGVGRPQVVLTLESGLPPVRLDPAALAQVVMNLLDNAVKYGRRATPHGERGGVPSDVSLTLTRRARRFGWPRRSWVALTVRDHGAGMPACDRRRVFRRFYRANATGQTHVAGLGLGLAVCQHAARGHGGWMEVSSTPGEGSAFTCYLPVTAAGGPGMKEAE